jgi:hypothetical protein
LDAGFAALMAAAFDAEACLAGDDAGGLAAAQRNSGRITSAATVIFFMAEDNHAGQRHATTCHPSDAQMTSARHQSGTRISRR